MTDISEMAVAAESAGADALSMINTLTGMRIDIRTRRPIIRNNTGGLSGPAVLPRGLADGVAGQPKGENPHRGPGGHLHLAGRRGNAPGGATALQIGTVLFTDPYAPIKIAQGLSRYMDENGIQRLSELTGGVKPW